ncbi:nitrite reductase domain protein, partial [Vibrio parahaemolyticus V-223/04]
MAALTKVKLCQL